MVVSSYLRFLTLSCFIALVLSGDTTDTIVELQYGKIQGRVAQTFLNNTFYAFQEIPYAAPPIGNLRFMPPNPVDQWDGVLETTKNTKICYQYWGSNSLAGEDCLYLNVYTPVVPNSGEQLPVLVYIHGGGFVSGDGTYASVGPEFFMDTKRIVVVTINYRLGPFGFLTTEDNIVPPNNGLKDQTFALKWVQENIHLFGGDPSKVTIDGQSAGSASVSYHVLSKQSEGLFRGAIMESGTVLTSWGYQRYAKQIAYQTAAVVDSSFTENNSSSELLALLQSISAEDLHSITSNKIAVPSSHINPGYIFAPTVDSGEDAFLPEPAYEALLQGEINIVPILMGMNSEETIAQASDTDNLKKKMANYDNDLSLIVNDDFHIQNVTEQSLIGEMLRKLYTDGLFQDDLGSSIRFLSDCRYTTSIIKYAQLVSQYTDIYFYQFSYDGQLGNVGVKLDGAESVAHSEELQYLWKNSRNNDVSKFPAADILTHQRLVELWTNFVTDLNPTPKSTELLGNIIWPLYTSDDHTYLDIREELEAKQDPKGNVFPTWDSIYQKYGIRPFDTY